MIRCECLYCRTLLLSDEDETFDEGMDVVCPLCATLMEVEIFDDSEVADFLADVEIEDEDEDEDDEFPLVCDADCDKCRLTVCPLEDDDTDDSILDDGFQPLDDFEIGDDEPLPLDGEEPEEK